MPSLRELFLAIPKHQVHKESRALLEGLVETVTLLVVAVSTLDPEPTEAEVVDARVGARLELAKAKAELDVAYQGFKATMLKVREEHDAELAEAKAEIGELTESRRWWKQRCETETRDVTRLQGITSAQGPRIKELVAEIRLLRHELAEAKAEIEGLLDSTELAEARAEIAVLQEQRDLERAAVMMGKPVGPEAEAQFEKLKVQAALGSAVKACDADYQIWALRRPYSPNKDRPWSAHTHNRIIATHRTLQGLLLALEKLIKASLGNGDPAEALRAIQEEGDAEG